MEHRPGDNKEGVDRLAKKGHAMERNWPGADLYDQEGDLTNITEGGENENSVKSDGVHREKREKNPEELFDRVVTERDMLEGVEDEDDEAARWLRDKGPEYGKK